MDEMLRKAKTEDLPALWRFYKEVCAAQDLSPYSPSWHIGIYPAMEDLEEYAAAGDFLLLLRDDQIVAAAVLTGRDDPMYADAAWLQKARSEDVSCIHLFAVHPAFRRMGLSDRLLEALADSARAEGKRLLRLDVVTGNLPAERLYRKHGFVFAEERQVYYEDTGEICVRLFERIL